MKHAYVSWTLAIALLAVLFAAPQVSVAGGGGSGGSAIGPEGDYVQVVIEGSIMAVDFARSTFVVNEHPIRWDPNTLLLDVSGKKSRRFELLRGMHVRVEAYDTTDGYLARLVRKTSETIAPVQR